MSDLSQGNVFLFVGTRRGLFRFRSDPNRSAWQTDELQIPGFEIYHATVDGTTGAGYAAARINRLAEERPDRGGKTA